MKGMLGREGRLNEMKRRKGKDWVLENDCEHGERGDGELMDSERYFIHGRMRCRFSIACCTNAFFFLE